MRFSAVISVGAAVDLSHGMSGSVRVGHFGAAPLVEYNSTRSRPTTLVNLGAYRTVKRMKIGIDVLNLLAAKDAEISYYYASRIAGEPAAGIEGRISSDRAEAVSRHDPLSDPGTPWPPTERCALGLTAAGATQSEACKPVPGRQNGSPLLPPPKRRAP
jgi:hypothetical protein